MAEEILGLDEAARIAESFVKDRVRIIDTEAYITTEVTGIELHSIGGLLVYNVDVNVDFWHSGPQPPIPDAVDVYRIQVLARDGKVLGWREIPSESPPFESPQVLLLHELIEQQRIPSLGRVPESPKRDYGKEYGDAMRRKIDIKYGRKQGKPEEVEGEWKENK